MGMRENAEKLTRAAGLQVLPNGASWIPPQDPYRNTIAALAVA